MLKSLFKKKIVRNLLSLSFAQIFSKGITVLTMAYLARTVSTQGFGKLEFARALLAYFGLIVNLGLDTLGTREIARDNSAVRFYVNSILSMRMILAFLAYFLYAVVVFSMAKPVEFTLVLLIMGGNLFASAFALNFVFQGLERMEIVAARTVLTSLLNLAGIYYLVSNENQVWLAALVMASSMLINSLWLLVYYVRKFGVIKFSIDWRIWKDHLKQALPMAASFFMIAIYYNMDMVMLGFLRSEEEVGIYGAAYKILLLALIPSQVILQAFFPRISAEKGDAVAKQKRMTPYVRMMAVVGFPIAVFGFIFAPDLIQIVYGSHFSAAAMPLRILMIDVVLVYINMIYGNPLLGWNRQNQYLKAISAGGIGNAILNILLIPKFGNYGAAIATVMGEVFVLIGLVYFHHEVTRSLYVNIFVKIMLISSCVFVGLWFSKDLFYFPLPVVMGILLYVTLIMMFRIVPVDAIKKSFC